MSGSEGECLRVVARAAGDHAFMGPVAESGKFVHDTANLERAGSLQVLGLEHDRAPATLAQMGR